MPTALPMLLTLSTGAAPDFRMATLALIPVRVMSFERLSRAFSRGNVRSDGRQV